MPTQTLAATSIVIFGASGDLTARKLVPALYNLFRKGRLKAPFSVTGFAFDDWSREQFICRMQEAVKHAEDDYSDVLWQAFSQNLYYQVAGFEKTEDFQKLLEHLQRLEPEGANRLYYLATAPRFFALIAEQLHKAGLSQENDFFRRLVIEKPFGHDLASAKTLNKQLHEILHETQLYRIDHYLGKETAQNILFFRFANTIFEPLWNRNHIDSVQISVTETVDVGHRAGYYDQAGVLRDMFQNHLLQLLALTAMEPPASFGADAIRNEKVKIFSSLRPIRGDDIVKHTIRGQYQGYLEAPGIAPDSATASYAALRVFIDTWRWQGVPFYLRSGKALAEKSSEILIQFKEPPHRLFPLPEDAVITSNQIAICLQPHEAIHLRFEVKVPDSIAEMRSVNMMFHYEDAFGQDAIPEAYERLILDALKGDASLFTRSDGLEHCWTFIDPIIEAWESSSLPPLHRYAQGSWGPLAANELLAEYGHHWIRGCKHEDKERIRAT